jgi:hypothetical protein
MIFLFYVRISIYMNPLDVIANASLKHLRTLDNKSHLIRTKTDRVPLNYTSKEYVYMSHIIHAYHKKQYYYILIYYGNTVYLTISLNKHTGNYCIITGGRYIMSYMTNGTLFLNSTSQISVNITDIDIITKLTNHISAMFSLYKKDKYIPKTRTTLFGQDISILNKSKAL